MDPDHRFRASSPLLWVFPEVTQAQPVGAGSASTSLSGQGNPCSVGKEFCR